MRRCPHCGTEMIHHVYGNRVYWVCPKCGNEVVTSKSAEIIMGTISSP